MGLFGTGHTKNGKPYHYPKNSNLTDNSENPVTYADLFVDDSKDLEDKHEFADERIAEQEEIEELEKIADQQKSAEQLIKEKDAELESSGFELSRKVMDEADEIGESGLNEDEKVLELYNLYQEHENLLSEAQKKIMLDKIVGIEKEMKLKGKNSNTAEKVQNSIQKRYYNLDGSKKTNSNQNQKREPTEPNSPGEKMQTTRAPVQNGSRKNIHPDIIPRTSYLLASASDD